jgi:hypothetical protein
MQKLPDIEKKSEIYEKFQKISKIPEIILKKF